MIAKLYVKAISARATRGVLLVGGLVLPCALGGGGQRWCKREGDGATPRGEWQLIAGKVRPGISRRGGVKLLALRRRDGWCDQVGDRNYNRAISLPYPASHEELWREDSLYDVVIELSHNRRPRVQGAGSAVFFHLSEDLNKPTQGCVALRKADMLRLLERLGPETRLVIRPPEDARRKSPSRPAPASRRR